MSIKKVDAEIWGYDFYYNHKRYRKSFKGLTKKQVESKYIEKLHNLREIKYGLAGGVEQSNPITFDAFSKEYLDGWAVDKKSKKTDEYHIAQLKHTFGAKDLRSINYDLVEAYRKKRRTEVSTTTVNREVSCLSGILSYAVRKDIIAKHPLRSKMTPLKEDQKERRILTDDEVDRLLVFAAKSHSPFLEPFIRISLNTGARPSEVLSLRWNDIDFDRRLLRIRECKTDRANRKGRTVQMNDTVIQVIQRIERGNEFIFFNKKTQSRVKNIRTGFEKARADAKIEGVSPYCLRHTVATKLVNDLGVDIVSASKTLGHSKIEMTLRYCHPTMDTLQRAVDRLGDFWSKKWTIEETEGGEEACETQTGAIN